MTPRDRSSSQADSPAHWSPQVPSNRHGVLRTGKNSFGLFRLYDEDSIPSINDPEDQSGADPLPTPVSQPILLGSMNPFYPYPNESSWYIGDWYWNQGAQKSKQSFKGLVEIITSGDFRTEDLHHANWTAIDRQLGSHESSQASPDSGEWQVEDGGWTRRSITISVPFSRRSLHPGPRNYAILDFHRRCLLSIILSDPICCKSFRFEPYSLRWKRSSRTDDVGVYGELFSSEAFINAHRDLQDVHLLDSASCTLPRRIVVLMFWSDATQLTAFGDAKLWPLYVYFGNESKYQHCTPTANRCSHAAYFRNVCLSYFVVTQYSFVNIQSSYLMVSKTLSWSIPVLIGTLATACLHIAIENYFMRSGRISWMKSSFMHTSMGWSSYAGTLLRDDFFLASSRIQLTIRKSTSVHSFVFTY